MGKSLVGPLALFMMMTASVGSAQTRNTLDEPIAAFSVPSPLPQCGMATALLQLERAAHIIFGFERPAECAAAKDWFPAGNGTTAVDLSGLTARQILDRLVQLAPEFQWRDMAGIAVIRAAAAWTDPADPLNAPAGPFTINNGLASEGIAAALRMPALNLSDRDPNAMSNQRFSVSFTGGTMLDALNAVAGAHGGAVWYLGWVPAQVADGSDEFPPVDLVVRMFDKSGFSIGTAVRPLQH